MENGAPPSQYRTRQGKIHRILEALRISANAERLIQWLKRARHIAARRETSPGNFLAMLNITVIQHYFKTALRETT